jgi:Mrp family chromosome partitioning ATPase
VAKGREASVTGVLSARPDGATSLAVGLATSLSEAHQVLLVDLCVERPEVATLLDVDGSPNVYQLAYQSRLGVVRPDDLQTHVQWHDGLAVLAGSWTSPQHREEISDPFIDGLLETAVQGFEHVVLDLGRPRASLPPALKSSTLVWVVTPSPLGLAALDSQMSQLDAAGCEWIASARVVLNRVSDRGWRGAGRFIEREYGMEVTGELPLAPEFWLAVEQSHSLRALRVPIPDRRRFVRAYGTDAWLFRQAIDKLVETLPKARPTMHENARAVEA